MHLPHVLGAGLSGIAACVLVASATQIDDPSVRIALFGTAASSAVAAGLMLTRRRASDPELDAARQSLSTEQAAFNQSRREFEEFLTATTQQLTDRARQLDGRELDLNHRRANFTEWLEYPQADETPVGDSPEEQLGAVRLTELDRQVLDVINEEARTLYGRLREGHYKPEGKLDALRIRDDLQAFVVRVARIYRPDSENPLLETSVDQLLRAGSRACLHLLVVMERLPLNVKDQTIQSLHGYVQKAIKAYELYTSAQPYMGYVQTASYVGRFIAGASPLTLGISWLVTELGKRGTKAAANWLVDQQAVAFLNEVVRVIGFEVASLYAGDFRHRDPNWIYAAELTHLMSCFPLSRENLSQALREVGGLPLRNEYDRIFLYRCLSSHRDVKPLIDAHESMSQPERQQIARRLERFYAAFIHGKTEDKVDRWRSGCEQRLGLKLVLSTAIAAVPASTGSRGGQSPADNLVKALAAFLLTIKGVNGESLSSHMHSLSSWGKLDEARRESLLSELAEDPPQSFEPPDVDVASGLVADFFQDLCRLAAHVGPWDMPCDEIVLEAAVFLGQDFHKTKKQLEQQYSEAFASRLPSGMPGGKLDGTLCRLALAELLPNEVPVWGYSATITWPAGVRPELGTSCAGLIATQHRLLAIEAGERGALVARTSHGTVALEKVDGRLINDCKLAGSHWEIDGSEGPLALTIVLGGSMLSRYETNFAPVINTVRGTAANLPQ